MSKNCQEPRKPSSPGGASGSACRLDLQFLPDGQGLVSFATGLTK